MYISYLIGKYKYILLGNVGNEIYVIHCFIFNGII